jgi:cation:H+ antiporter
MIARWLGVSELVISTTIMAASTSLPEVVTSLVAVIRGEKDIAVGNVVGSNIFNLLGICGIAGLISPENIPVAPALLHFDLPVAIVVCLACLPIFFTKHLISRWEGVLFLGYYVAFTIYVLMAAQDHDALAAYSQVLMLFAIPLTAITLVIGVYRSIPKPYR